MSTTTRRKAPTQYHRRLRLLAAVVAVILLGLVVQAIRLTVVQGEQHRRTAEARLQSRTWLPTWRGSILDRDGRIMARDVPRWEVAVSWDAITGQWAEDRAVRRARSDLGREFWQMASPERRAAEIAARRPAEDAVLNQLWDEVAAAAGESRDELASRLNAIRGYVQQMASVVWAQQRRRHEARFGDGPEFVPRPIREQVSDHVIVPDLHDAPAARLEAFASSHADLVELRYARHREHPMTDVVVSVDLSTLPGPLRESGERAVLLPEVAGRLLGSLRNEVWAEDVARRPFVDPETGVVDRGGYRTKDLVGAGGIEQAWEDTLRGEVGELIVDRDHDKQQRTDAVPGRDVQLTISGPLQARLEAVLSPSLGLTKVQPWHANSGLPIGTILPASAVVLDIERGEVLAMASSLDTLNLDEMSEAERDSLQPWLLRSVQVAAPPGSIIKPLVLAAALSEGVLLETDQIECRGHHFENQLGIARCWIYRPKYNMATHGTLGAEEALARSCNCWFYELGDRLGLERLSEWLGNMGLGEQLDTGLTPPWSETPIEAAGNRPEGEVISALHARGEATFESVMLAIGQGRSAWTPLHAADAYATLARGGRRIPPTIVRGYRSKLSSPGWPLVPSAVERTLQGLEDVVSQSYGTANHLRLPTGREPIFRVQGQRIAAKTGTAQAPPWRRDVDGDGVVAAGERTSSLEHAWVAALVGDEGEPFRYAIAVLVEYGGSGGRAAGPIADQVIRAMQDTGLLAGGGQ